jgi:antirestriction protein ArdC
MRLPLSQLSCNALDTAFAFSSEPLGGITSSDVRRLGHSVDRPISDGRPENAPLNIGEQKMTTRTASIYETITNQIIAQLESGVAPWRKPWATSGGGGMPHNVMGRRYRGVNVLLLWAASEAKGYSTQKWATFNQWRNLGGHVNKGEKGTQIVFWSVSEKTERDEETGEESALRRFFARYFTVFNLDQCGGEALDRFRCKRPVREFTDFTPAEEAIAATGADIRHGGGAAFYSPSSDYIQLPLKGSFEREAAYYSTALHELVHWSGHEDRLKRLDKLARFGDATYAAEELVAELGASFLTASLGVPNCGIQDNAAYLQHWLKVLRGDNRAIFTASTAASAAADYILGFSRPAEPADSEEEAVLV